MKSESNRVFIKLKNRNRMKKIEEKKIIKFKYITEVGTSTKLLSFGIQNTLLNVNSYDLPDELSAHEYLYFVL